METLFVIGRVVLGALAIFAGFSHLLHISNMTMMARMNKVPAPKLMVFLTGVALILAGLGVAFWVYIEISLWILLVFFASAALMIHRFWTKKKLHERAEHMHYFMGNMMLVGLILIMLVVI